MLPESQFEASYELKVSDKVRNVIFSNRFRKNSEFFREKIVDNLLFSISHPSLVDEHSLEPFNFTLIFKFTERISNNYFNNKS